MTRWRFSFARRVLTPELKFRRKIDGSADASEALPGLQFLRKCEN